MDGGGGGGDNSNVAGYYLSVLALLALAQSCLCLTRNLLLHRRCLSAAASIHSALLLAVADAPVSFLAKATTGAVASRYVHLLLLLILLLFLLINYWLLWSRVCRMSGDLDVADRDLARVGGAFLFTLCEILAMVVVVSAAFPAFLVAVPFLLLFYCCLLRVYLPSARQIRRYEAASRAPVNLMVSESSKGASAVRAFGEDTR